MYYSYILIPRVIVVDDPLTHVYMASYYVCEFVAKLKLILEILQLVTQK